MRKFYFTFDLMDIQHQSDGPCWDDLGAARVIVWVAIGAAAMVGACVFF